MARKTRVASRSTSRARVTRASARRAPARRSTRGRVASGRGSNIVRVVLEQPSQRPSFGANGLPVVPVIPGKAKF